MSLVVHVSDRSDISGHRRYIDILITIHRCEAESQLSI